MKTNEDICVIFVDLGYPRVDGFLEAYPDRAWTVGASEQTALDMACGLAYEGKIPVVYTITPFLYRGFETIRTFIDHEKLKVVMVGAGRDKDYALHDGFSHDASDDENTFRNFKNITCYWPSDKEDLDWVLDQAIKSDHATYINVKR